ncbi:putative major capsid protein [Sulfolobales Beppu filamentous virus 2]|uniref:Putative major capsid protein n=1 Tax=Sulfolobales Beppu filamentous virus 2 TaxID=2493123 RepID=A0A3S8NEZ4_9VIRU|nr:putative major capsid protein [Sulfolobales Beppu filamentous virus 2]AZI75800.1 putative major capsid protein [Sulfolobales Beppu filamentous virus 2]
MPSRRTGRSTQDSITIYSEKIPTQQKAYKNATKAMVVQAQNIYAFFSEINSVILPWLNTKGIAGNQRLTWRQLAYEYIRILNTKQNGELLKRMKIALKHSYILRGLDPDMIDEYLELLDTLKPTVQNYIQFSPSS